MAVAFASPTRADLLSAIEAYRAGDFDTAGKQFLELAELGEARSQYNLSVMALQGEGMTKDEAAAVGWMRVAKQNGYAKIDDGRLELLEAGLDSQGQETAAQIVARYGRDALAARVLPAALPLRCQQPFFAPRVKQMARSTYPLLAQRSGLDGIVIMRFIVGVDGLARDVEVLAASYPGRFDEAAIIAVLQSRFEPARLNGTPVEARAEMRHTFMMWEGGDLWRISAVARTRELAAAGDSSSQYLVGLLGLLDPSLKIPETDARQMLLASAQTGYPEAQYWIGRHLNSQQACTGIDKSKPWLQQAAKSKLGSAHIAYAYELLQRADWATKRDEIQTLVKAAAQTSDAYSVKHAVALLAVPVREGMGDAKAALVAARKLDGMDAEYDPQVSEVIAAAYAANGDFAKAAQRQARAIETAKDLYWNTSAMQTRLASYKESKTWSGDLLALPPATEPLPDVEKPNRGCPLKDGKCERVPDEGRR